MAAPPAPFCHRWFHYSPSIPFQALYKNWNDLKFKKNFFPVIGILFAPEVSR